MATKPENQIIHSAKNRIINSLYLVFLIMMFPLITASITRYFTTGWKTVYTFHILIGSSFFLIYFFRKNINQTAKVIILIGYFLFGIIIGLLNFGYLAGAKYFFFIIIVLAALFLGKKYATAALIGSFLIFCCFAFLFHSGILDYNFDLNDYIRNPSSWFSSGVAIFLVLIAITLIANKVLETYKHLLDTSNKNEELYRILFEQAPMGIVIGNSKGEILMVNKQFCDLIGYNQEKIIGRKLDNFFSKDILLEKPLRYDLVDQGQIILNERKIMPKSGKAIDIEMYSHKLPDGRLQSFMRDISDRKDTEKKLAKEQEFTEHILNMTPGIFSVYEGKKNPKLIRWNKNQEEILGYTSDELLNKSFFSFYHSDNKPKLIEAMTQLNNLGETRLETEVRKKDGTTIPMMIIVKAIKDDKKDYYLGFAYDVSERKKLERDIYIESIRAEENERERFARELHDDLGPMLTTSKIYLRSLNDLEDTNQRTKYIDRASKFLDDALLSIREISNNLSPHIIRNYGLISALASFIEKVEEATSINFLTNMDFEINLNELSEITIYRTLVELINNSLKHAHAKNISIDMHTENNYLEILYADDGVGFNYEKIKSTSKGFGLLNLENRIKTIGGEYSFNSTLNEGVEVTIKLNLENMQE